jgi:hypothetical protein
MYCPVKEIIERRIEYNYELHVVYEDMDIITVIKVCRLK